MSIISDEISIYELIAKLITKLIKIKREEQEHLIGDRFISLFKSHGITPGQIPRFFPDQLRIDDCKNKKTITAKLTTELLENTAQLFGINTEWLENASDKLYYTESFYKDPDRFADFLENQIDTEPYHTSGQLLISNANGNVKSCVFILSTPICQIEDKLFYKHVLCDLGCVYDYWKCRADITACIAQASKKNILLKGFEITEKALSKIASGEHFISPTLEQPKTIKSAFDCEKLFLSPDVFLKGIDEGDFGKTSALSRWLHWADKGLMDTGWPSAQEEFAQRLAQYK